jgi:hypothetical protein
MSILCYIYSHTGQRDRSQSLATHKHFLAEISAGDLYDTFGHAVWGSKSDYTGYYFEFQFRSDVPDRPLSEGWDAVCVA